MKRPGLIQLLSVGAGHLRRYTGLLIAVYLIGLVPSLAVGALTARGLAAHIATRPICDQLLGGDLVSAARCVGDAAGLFAGLGTAALFAVIAHALVSWFLVAGLVTVLMARCHDRREVAERFGAGGAASFGAFARLFGWSLPLWTLVGVTALFGLAALVPPVTRVFSLGDYVGRVLLALSPAALMALWVATVVAYARIDLVRHPELPARRALLRAALLVITDPRLLVHAAAGPAVFALLTCAYVALTFDRSLTGLGGVVTLLALRQATAIGRFAAGVVVLGGQVELSESVVFPPLRKDRDDDRDDDD